MLVRATAPDLIGCASLPDRSIERVALMLNVKILTSSMLFFHFHQGAPVSECNKAARGPRSLPRTYGGAIPGP